MPRRVSTPQLRDRLRKRRLRRPIKQLLVRRSIFESDILRIVSGLTSGITVAKDQSGQAARRLDEIRQSVGDLVDAGSAVHDEVAGIATSTEELTLAANEISSTVEIVRERSASTVSSASDSARDMAGLGEAVNEIGSLLTAIGDCDPHRIFSPSMRRSRRHEPARQAAVSRLSRKR